MNLAIASEIVYHRTKAKNPSVYPIEIKRFTIGVELIPVDKMAMVQHCRDGCSSFGRNGACPPFSPDIQELITQYRWATVVYARLQARYYPVRVVRGQPRASWKYTESFLPAFLRRQVLEIARQLDGLPLTAGRCTSCRLCSFASGQTRCARPELRTYSLGGCGVKVSELMENFSDSPLVWWDSSNAHSIPPYQVRVGMILHGTPG